jgi:pimeloyl-ACP methyl ester carboxylesterase
MRSTTKVAVVLLTCFIIAFPGWIQANESNSHDAPHNGIKPLNSSALFPGLPDIPGSRRYMEVEPVSNGNVFVYEAGSNNQVSVVLIHGVGDEGSRIWGHIIPELAQRYQVITFDLPGFGRSSKQNILYSPPLYAEFVRWVVERYTNGRPLIVVGHSLGAGVALCHAALYPENLQRLILVDASGVIHRQALSQHMVANISGGQSGLAKLPSQLLGEILENSLGSLESNSSSEWIDKILTSPGLRENVLGGESQKIAGLALANFDFSTLLEQIKVPAVIIWGANDPVTPIRTGKLLTHVLKRTQLFVIPGTGHNPILEKTEHFNGLLQKALVTKAWKSPWTSPKKTSREVDLSRKHNLTLTGHYTSIKLSHCGNIVLKDVETEYLEILHCDDIVIENSRITGKEFALNTVGSRIQMTGVHLRGETGIVVSGCILDMAGVKIEGDQAAVSVQNGSKLLFSVSKVVSPFNSGHVHGSYEVPRGHLF